MESVLYATTVPNKPSPNGPQTGPEPTKRILALQNQMTAHLTDTTWPQHCTPRPLIDKIPPPPFTRNFLQDDETQPQNQPELHPKKPIHQGGLVCVCLSVHPSLIDREENKMTAPASSESNSSCTLVFSPKRSSTSVLENPLGHDSGSDSWFPASRDIQHTATEDVSDLAEVDLTVAHPPISWAKSLHSL